MNFPLSSEDHQLYDMDQPPPQGNSGPPPGPPGGDGMNYGGGGYGAGGGGQYICGAGCCIGYGCGVAIPGPGAEL